MNHYLIILICVFSGYLNAQSTIYGTVTDNNGFPVEGADIYVEGTDSSYFSEEDGSFVIEVDNAGTYTFVVDAFGYEEYSKEIEIGENVKLEWLPILFEDTENQPQELGEVVVSGKVKSRESAEAALRTQKNAIEIKEVRGAEELSRLGKSDAAQAVSAIAGISKQEGTGAVYVRGLGDRYLNTTLNGLSLPSNNVNKKNIDLDIFPSDVIQSVAVSKAYSSEFSADFGSGAVDIASKEHRGKDYIRIGVGSRVNTNSIGEDFVMSEGTGYFGTYGRTNDNPWATALLNPVNPVEASGVSPYSTNVGVDFGKTFKFENKSKLSIFGSASFNNGYDYKKGFEQNFTASEIVRFPNVEKYNYSTTTTTMTSIDMKFNSKNHIKYNTLFINSTNDEVGYFGTEGLGTQRDIVADAFFQSNVQYNQDIIWVNQLLGENELTDKIKVDWGVGYNILKSNEPDRKRLSLVNYDNLLDNDPNTIADFANDLNFRNQRYSQDIDDNEINARVKFTYEINDDLNINFGGKSRYKDREFENNRIGYEILVDAVPSIASLDEFFSIDNLGVNYNTTVINPLTIPDGNGGTITLPNTNLPGAPENTYDAQIVSFGTFVDFEWKINDKWLIVPGIRYEDISQEIEWDVINFALNNPGILRADESLILPSLNVKYSLNDDTNLRFSGSLTASLPEFKEFAPFVYEGVTQSIGGNPDVLGRTNSNNINYVNVPDVSYSEILNLDLKYEWFLSKKELISLAVFYKNIQDPINLVVGASASGEEFFFRTGENAEVFGVELELKKTILDLSNHDFFIGFNASYMDTNQDLYDRISGSRSVNFTRSSDELQGASKFIGNLDLNYKTKFGNLEPTFTLVGNYFSNRIYSLGSGSIGNKVEKGIPTVDFLISTDIGKKSKLKIGAKNLLNPEIEIFRETGGADVTLESYKIGTILSVGFEYKF